MIVGEVLHATPKAARNMLPKAEEACEPPHIPVCFFKIYRRSGEIANIPEASVDADTIHAQPSRCRSSHQRELNHLTAFYY